MRINGIDLTGFTNLERRILVTLGLSYPGYVHVNELIEVSYPNPDIEPERADDCVRIRIRKLRGKLFGWTIRGIYTRGYRLERIQ